MMSTKVHEAITEDTVRKAGLMQVFMTLKRVRALTDNERRGQSEGCELKNGVM